MRARTCGEEMETTNLGFSFTLRFVISKVFSMVLERGDPNPRPQFRSQHLKHPSLTHMLRLFNKKRGCNGDPSNPSVRNTVCGTWTMAVDGWTGVQ
jgi:hypothetical protein